MPILNYTTQVKASKTVGEIQTKLAQAGALSVSVSYDEKRQPDALVFAIQIHGEFVNFKLPSNWQGVFAAMKKDRSVPRRFQNEEQARQVAWRIVKDWVEAQLAIIEAGMATLPEVFLPYAIMANGLTVYQQFESGRLLGAG
jgi:hypothetical protein